MKAREWTVGVDFGGTNIKVGFVNARGRVFETRVLDTRQLGAPHRFVPAVSQTIQAMIRSMIRSMIRGRAIARLQRSNSQAG